MKLVTVGFSIRTRIIEPKKIKYEPALIEKQCVNKKTFKTMNNSLFLFFTAESNSPRETQMRRIFRYLLSI